MTYWHASFDPLPVGTTLVPRLEYENRWSQDCAGRILENLRPAHLLAHRDAVFMCMEAQDCDNAGAHCEWLFGVKAQGKVERHDMEWATEIYRLISDGWPLTDPRIVELARRYWYGEASDAPTWEYLTPAANIMSVERY